jgi:hypothetical protein
MRLRQKFGLGALMLALLASTASAQGVTGAIKGTVTDETTGVPLLLVTVVATSPALQGQQSEFTDAAGQFFMSNLPPGTYSLLFIYGDAKVKRENIEVGLGKETVVNGKINTQATGEVITIREKAPTIDAGSTKQGTTIQQDYLKHVPNRGRTYSGVLGAAAGSQGDTYGVGFSGSTSVENTYVVDGVNTTGVTMGANFPTEGSQVVNNFIQEIEVITGGYNAEFGRSTGGVVNVITKTGSNEFHGSVFGNVTALSGSTDSISAAGSAIRAQQAQPREFDFGFEVGGPIIKDRLWFYVGFAPFMRRRSIDRIVSTAVDRERRFYDYDNPNCAKNIDGSCNADVATDPTGATSRLPVNGQPCEIAGTCEGDGFADLDATNFTVFEEIERSELTSTYNNYQFTGKLNFAVTPEHQGQIGLTGQAASTRAIGVLGTPSATQTDTSELNTDVAAKWTSKFFDNKTQVDVVAGWHRYKQNVEPTHEFQADGSRTRDTSAVRFASGPSNFLNLGVLGRNPDQPEGAQTLQFCTDGDPNDPFPRIVNCPVSNYQLFAPAQYSAPLEQRYSGKVTVTQRVKALGHHQFKVGVDFENNLLEDKYQRSGGHYDALYGLGGQDAIWEQRRFVRINPDGATACGTDYDPATGAPTTPNLFCDLVGERTSSGNTMNYGAFLQDSWSILPNLTVNAGVRWEAQYLRYSEQLQNTFDTISMKQLGKNALELNNLWAPRLGLIYDWTKEGRSKVYASWGRFYEAIPMDMNNRAFGGDAESFTDWDWQSQCGAPPTGTDPNTTLNVPSLSSGCPDAAPSTFDEVPYDVYTLGGTTLVVPETGPQYLDELTVGVEYEVLEDLRLGLSYQNRRLGRVIEDLSSDGGHSYFIGNPGEFDEASEQDLISQIEMASDPALREALIHQLETFQGIRQFDKPRRDYNAIQLTAAKRFSRAFMVQGSYTYSVLRGNYPGLFSPDTGQLDPNITSQYDLIELMANRDGPLPFDRPHQFKIDGYYTFDLQAAGRVTAGARIRGQSGSPMTAYGRHNAYGLDESLLLPRGALESTAFQTSGDLHVAYGRKLGSAMDLEVFFEVFNVLNQQVETAKDKRYTSTNVDPIVGGEEEDLAHAKVSSNPNGVSAVPNEAGLMHARTMTRNRNFFNTSARNAPITARFGLTLSF